MFLHILQRILSFPRINILLFYAFTVFLSYLQQLQSPQHPLKPFLAEYLVFTLIAEYTWTVSSDSHFGHTIFADSLSLIDNETSNFSLH